MLGLPIIVGSSASLRSQTAVQASLASTPTNARTPDGKYISWREHLIDDEATGGVAIRGGDGLKIADLDKDGYLDIVSVHESDTQYDGALAGYIRIAFGTKDPDRWVLTTLASGKDAAAAEDVSIADLNGDGFLDIVAACELAHLIYFQNPGKDIRTKEWERVIPPAANNRGSFIRVFAVDLDGDGKPEIVSPNKGAQGPRTTQPPTAISWFKISGSPLDGKSWVEHELTKVVWPITLSPWISTETAISTLSEDPSPKLESSCSKTWVRKRRSCSASARSRSTGPRSRATTGRRIAETTTALWSAVSIWSLST